MSRLPDLERALFDAAARLEARASGIPEASDERRLARRWRRRSTPLLAGLATLLLAGGALAAATGLLKSGDRVPDAPDAARTPVSAITGFTLAGIRAADPAGGPPWGIATYDATPRPSKAGETPASAARVAQLRDGAPVTCVVVGRIQAEQLGVVGRDGVFGNDGRFHALSPAAQSSGACSGRGANGSFVSMSSGPPIPASGYTGPVGTAIGGCRERVDLDGPTVSPQTRRKLRGVPQCAASGLRQVVAGFAGPRAKSVMLAGGRYRRTLRVLPKENGAYLFVLRAGTGPRPELTIIGRNGRSCHPFAGRMPASEAQRAAFARNLPTCGALSSLSRP
ncbi:MAG: hypothetical protein QOJ35_4114 [Solirubrobacteraceae bacterium]|jgi:hypothetical protein|nr:hypothetical protein [Solirubrobacteraceae bacterium]